MSSHSRRPIPNIDSRLWLFDLPSTKSAWKLATTWAKALHVLLVLAQPMWLLRHHGIGCPMVLAGYLTGQMIASYFLVAMILGTHWAEVDFVKPAADGTVPHTWHEHAFVTSCDWESRPRWLGYWLGGLNHHLTHHIFPTYSHRHYPALATIVAELADKHRLRYRVLRYGRLVALQQQFLKAIGQRPKRPQPAALVADRDVEVCFTDEVFLAADLGDERT